MIVSIGS